MEKTENKKEFGLLSMIAMVIGIVIGSGIFAKNAGLISTNGSIYITFSAWIIGALLVFAIIIAFLEIFTITEITNEQSTFTNWSKRLINERAAKIIGIYFVFVNLPISIVALTMFAANRIIDVSFIDTNVITNTTQYFITRLAVVFVLLAYFFTVNGFYTKPGKILQNTGTMVKVIPLLFVFIVFIIGAGIGGFNHSLNPIFSGDFNKAISSASGVKNDGINGVIVFAATMPAIIFVFDGFLTSGSLSKDAKSPNTYRMAVLFGMIIVTVIYLSYSLGVFALGTPFEEIESINFDGSWKSYLNLSEANRANVELNSNYGEINNAIMSQFGLQWLASSITIIVAISILTSVSGILMSAIRNVSDMSSNNLIPDPDGKAIIRNEHNSFPNAMKIVLWYSIVYIIIMIGLDAIAIPNQGWNTDDYYHMTASSDFFSNLTSVGSFIVMIILIGFGLLNRRTNKVEVKKNKLFIPSGIIAIATMSIIIVLYVLQLFWFDPNAAVGTIEYGEYLRSYIVQIVTTLIWLISTPVIYFYMEYRTKDVEISDEKKELINKYREY